MRRAAAPQVRRGRNALALRGPAGDWGPTCLGVVYICYIDYRGCDALALREAPQVGTQQKGTDFTSRWKSGRFTKD